MNPAYEKLQRCFKSVREKTDFVPKVALVLGSGLGDYAKNIRIVDTIDYSDIEEFPQSTVAGHAGRFIFGYVGEVPVVCMQGRVHYYEGYPITDVVLPTRLMGLLGAKYLFLTNAAGGAQDGMKPGDFMVLTDHISVLVPSPLIGPNMDELGVRFPDVSNVYTKELQEIVRECAKAQGVGLKEGVYMQFTGPAYETPAEVKMAKLLGADACGMSTACEATAAAHMGLKVLGISCITNLAAGISPVPLSHEEVKIAADEAAPRFEALTTAVIEKIGQLA